MGVNKMSKENTYRCDFNDSLKPLPVSNKDFNASKNASLLGSVRSSVNY